MQQNKDFIESILKERYYLDYETAGSKSAREYRFVQHLQGYTIQRACER